METAFSPSRAHLDAARNFARAEAILRARTGESFGSRCLTLGSRAAVLEENPDLAPGFNGLDFDTP